MCRENRLTEKYRNPVMILADGALGQMMEKVVMRPAGSLPQIEKPWATTGKLPTRERNILTSLFIVPERMEEINLKLQDKYRRMRQEIRSEETGIEDAEILLVAFGLSARICQKAIELARDKGIKVGLLRPITLFPFPSEAIANIVPNVEAVLTVEMNSGQMVEDVKLAVNGRKPVYFKGRMGGMIPTPDEIVLEIETIAEKNRVVQV